MCIRMGIGSRKRQFQISTSLFEIFKSAYKHIPCVESTHTAKYKHAKCRIWQVSRIQILSAPNTRLPNITWLIMGTYSQN